MAWYNNIFKKKEKIDETIEAFKPSKTQTDVQIKAQSGEGWEELNLIQGYGSIGLSTFNLFYNNMLNKSFENERQKIMGYREMAEMAEISDVVEDATNESIKENEEGKLLHLDIINSKLKDNENITRNLQREFDDLFYEKINFYSILWDMFRSYMIDGRVFYERIINKNKKTHGIINIKKLPSETMDYLYNPLTGKIEFFFQYLNAKAKKPASLEDAKKRNDIVIFYPDQIGFINYGVYGKTKYEISGYLEKCRIPYNQLKLLETSVIIYRIIRAPERLVFRIDTGNMPRDKALKYVEKIKQKMTKKQTYNPSTGQLSQEPEVLSLLENYYMPQCLRISNTYINLLDGREISLKNLIKEHNEGKKHEVYSVDQKTSKIIRGEVQWAGITRKNTDLVRVWIDNDKYVDTTPDHKFVMRDGSEIEAQNLKPNDSLMPLYLRSEKITKKSNDYTQIYNPKSDKWEFVHRLLGPKPKRGYAIHHINFNRFNNMKNNLKSMLIKEHITLHCKLNKERKSHIPLLEALNKPENREKQRNAAKKYQLKRWSNPDNIKKISEYMKKRWKEDVEYKENIIQNVFSQPKSEKHKKKLSESNINFFNSIEGIKRRSKIGKESKKRWENLEYKKFMSESQKSIIDENVKKLFISEYMKNKILSMPKFMEKLSNSPFMEYWSKLNKNIKGVRKDKIGKDSFYKILKSMGFSDYINFKENFIINHKVSKIEYLSEKDDTGCLTIKDPGKNHNFGLSCGIFVKNSADGRGSQIESVGGQSAGFTELDDIYYFARKMYRALKYPLSRVSAGEEKREADIMFGGNNTGEITRDEVKWSRFLESQQRRFCKDLSDLFLIHLEMKGLKKQYNISIKDIKIKMNAPSNYKEQIEQNEIESRFNNYQLVADRDEFSKYFLMKRYLRWSEKEIMENVKGMKKDKELGLKSEEEGM